MTTVLDLLEASASSSAHAVFLPEREPVSLAVLWRRSLGACAWLRARTEPGDSVAVMLDSSAAALSALVGAWLAGLHVASLPHAGPRTAMVDHLRELRPTIDATGARLTLLAARHRDAILASDAVALEEVASGASGPTGPVAAGSLTQYSSGTTGAPKGVVLPLEALAANVEAIIDVFEDGEPLTSVSWLPLSHDMGLIGLCLAPWAYAARARGGRGVIGLIPPDTFVRSPSVWLRSCSELGANATGGPNFALDVVARRPPPGDVDLRRLRIVCVGAEPVRADTLRAFATATAPLGFDPRAFCPAYGLAEASLAVTCTRPPDMWRSSTVDPVALCADRWEIDEEGLELVSAGPPVKGADVAISDEGEVMVRSRSMFSRYAGRDDAAATADGWFATGDSGVLHDGDLYVTGRLDDRLSIGGRNIHTAPVEQALDRLPGLAPGRSTVIADERGRYVTIAERRRRSARDGHLRELAAAVKAEATRATGMVPGRVILVAPRSFPTTPNGKVRRRQVRSAFWSGELAVDWDSHHTKETA